MNQIFHKYKNFKIIIEKNFDIQNENRIVKKNY